MVAVTADGPTRHMMSLAPEQQAPANPVSTIPPAMVADELPVALERKPQPNMIPITTRSGRLVKPVPRLINLMMSELVSSTKRQMNPCSCSALVGMLSTPLQQEGNAVPW